MFAFRWAWPARCPIRPILGFWGSKVKKIDSLPWTPMNRRAKCYAASFILGGEIRVRTNTHKRTVSDISTPCLLACVDKKLESVDNFYGKRKYCQFVWLLIVVSLPLFPIHRDANDQALAYCNQVALRNYVCTCFNNCMRSCDVTSCYA